MDSVDMKQANAFDGRTKWRLLAAGLPSSLTKFPPEEKHLQMKIPYSIFHQILTT
jgi:hypothetical protein